MDTVKDLTIEQLRAIIRDVVSETLREVLTTHDPDAGLALRPEVEARLAAFWAEDPEHRALGQPVADVAAELGIDAE